MLSTTKSVGLETCRGLLEAGQERTRTAAKLEPLTILIVPSLVTTRRSSIVPRVLRRLEGGRASLLRPSIPAAPVVVDGGGGGSGVGGGGVVIGGEVRWW